MDKMQTQEDTQTQRKIPNILVTGVPGAGKTTFCQLLNESLNFEYLGIGKMVKQNHLYKNWNEQFDVPQFDEDLLLDFIEQKYNIEKGGLLFDFHSSDFFPIRYFDLVVLIRCQSDLLYKRLEQRGYKQKKIKQNVDCQIFQVVKQEVYENYDHEKIIQVWNSKKEDMEKCLQLVMQRLLEYKKKFQGQTQVQGKEKK